MNTISLRYSELGLSTVLHVGMADLVAARHPATLISLGLGSCIGIAIYDEQPNAGETHRLA
ncbi:hypothetical protein [Acetomicrobium sp. S15 = DSM 107314]|uniref:hypothetical protein n=1 Tax=Acetomicrobium sp. S15 = DSM 107314 TaxID=2529858 RepID=UPI001E3A75BD|nr:hypothetical protein [Acetomicrobium sp. S15 = DSM 107314]